MPCRTVQFTPWWVYSPGRLSLIRHRIHQWLHSIQPIYSCRPKGRTLQWHGCKGKVTYKIIGGGRESWEGGREGDREGYREREGDVTQGGMGKGKFRDWGGMKARKREMDGWSEIGREGMIGERESVARKHMVFRKASWKDGWGEVRG